MHIDKAALDHLLSLPQDDDVSELLYFSIDPKWKSVISKRCVHCEYQQGGLDFHNWIVVWIENTGNIYDFTPYQIIRTADGYRLSDLMEEDAEIIAYSKSSFEEIHSYMTNMQNLREEEI